MSLKFISFSLVYYKVVSYVFWGWLIALVHLVSSRLASSCLEGILNSLMILSKYMYTCF